MKRRQVLKWSAPVISVAALPVHAQTSNCDPSSDGPSTGIFPAPTLGASLTANDVFRGRLFYGLPDVYESAEFTWQITSQPTNPGLSVAFTGGSQVSAMPGDDGILRYEVTSDGTVVAGQTDSYTITVQYTAILGENYPGVICGLDESTDTQSFNSEFVIPIMVI